MRARNLLLCSYIYVYELVVYDLTTTTTMMMIIITYAVNGERMLKEKSFI